MIRIVLAAMLALCLASNAEARQRHRHFVPVSSGQIVGGRPAGCPYQFCGCGASLHVFNRIIPALNRAAAWFRFPRTSPTPGMAAVRAHHVMILEAPTSHPGIWLVWDPNGGHHLTWLHERSILSYRIVDPHGR